MAEKAPRKAKENVQQLRQLFRRLVKEGGKEEKTGNEKRRKEKEDVKERKENDDGTEKKEAVKGKRQGSQERTIFETYAETTRPAVVVEKAFELKWKEGCKPAEKKQEESDEMTDFEEQMEKSRTFKIACMVMGEARISGLLESALSQSQNEAIRVFFEDRLSNPSPDLLKLLNLALDRVYTRMVFYTTEHNLIMTPALRTFLLDKDRAKARMLDVILSVPDLAPTCWGGQVSNWQLSENGGVMNAKAAQVIIEGWAKAGELKNAKAVVAETKPAVEEEEGAQKIEESRTVFNNVVGVAQPFAEKEDQKVAKRKTSKVEVKRSSELKDDQEKTGDKGNKEGPMKVRKKKSTENKETATGRKKPSKPKASDKSDVVVAEAPSEGKTNNPFKLIKNAFGRMGKDAAQTATAKEKRKSRVDVKK